MDTKQTSCKGTSVSRYGRILYGILQGVNVALATAGFFTPPIGSIDGSVISVIGILSFSGMFAMLPTVIASGTKWSATVGKASMSLESTKEQKK